MPIYEYRCGRCSNNFETLVRSAAEKIACPACASPKVERLLSVFSSGRDVRGLGGSAAPSGGCGCTPSTCGCN